MRSRAVLATAVVFATVAAAVAVGGCSSGQTATTGTKSGGMVMNAPTVAMHTVINGGVQTIRT